MINPYGTVTKKPRIPVWQSGSLVAVHVYRDGEEIDYPDKQWDLVKLRYLLATQPRSGIAVFSGKAAEVADGLGLPMLFRDEPITRIEIEVVLNEYANELADQLGEPGSEDVAIFIRSTYPRTGCKVRSEWPGIQGRQTRTDQGRERISEDCL